MTVQDRGFKAQLPEGSPEWLGDLYNRHRTMVFRTALAITGDLEAASDLLQDVFLRLHRFADRIDCKRPLEPWLYRMTANLAYTWMKRNRRGFGSLEEVAEKCLGNADRESPHVLTEERDEWERVQRALFALPLQQRVVVVMYYLNDLSMQEIAETLDVPVGTVKSRLHYARRALQHNLEFQRITKGNKLAWQS